MSLYVTKVTPKYNQNISFGYTKNYTLVSNNHKKAFYLYCIKKLRIIMEIEILTKQELSSIKGGRWVYWDGKWYWIEETR